MRRLNVLLRAKPKAKGGYAHPRRAVSAVHLLSRPIAPFADPPRGRQLVTLEDAQKRVPYGSTARRPPGVTKLLTSGNIFRRLTLYSEERLFDEPDGGRSSSSA
jgi:anti-sigma factor RsiW